MVSGCFIGMVAGCMNIYMGLKIGWTQGASLMAAILAYAVSLALWPKRSFSVLETNISQTTGSAAGQMASAAGLVSSIPAMGMLGYHIEWYALMLWGLAVSFLGVFFAVPLRRQYIEQDKLRFPSGTATANTIMSMYATEGEATAQARVLLQAGVVAAVFTLASYFVHQIEEPPLHLWAAQAFGSDFWLSAALGTAAAWTFTVYLGPMMLGGGFLIGPRVGTSLLVGAVVGWGILGPLATQMGWANGPPQNITTGGRGWILWPGAAIMVADALMALALSYKTILRTFSRAPALDLGDGQAADDRERIPNSWWMGGLVAGGTVTCVIASLVFDIPPHLSIIAILMSSVLAAIAVRSTGETDINPVGGMGKVTQMVFGGLSPGNMSTNLMAAAITGAGASQAGDMMHDLKTGHMLGASPRNQFLAQLVGIAAGVVAVVPIYFLFDHAYEIGTGRLPAPAAHAWKAVAEVMSKGFDSLPMHAEWAIVAGLVFGASLPLIRKLAPRLAPFTPSGMAVGIAFIVHAYYSMIMFAGAMVYVAWKANNPESAKRFAFAVACGLIAGEGLMGVAKAVMTILGVPTLT